MTENGPDAYDEINPVEPGLNSGWVQLMGPVARNARGIADLAQISGSHYRDPAFSWFDPVAPTAIVFLNTRLIGDRCLNHILVGDITTGTLYHFTPNANRDGFAFVNPGPGDLVAAPGDAAQALVFGGGFGGISDVKVGPDGRVYVLSFGLGKIFAVAPVPATLQGAVTDSVTAAGLAGVRVQARRLEPTPRVRSAATTDAAGLYTLRDVGPGRLQPR